MRSMTVEVGVPFEVDVTGEASPDGTDVDVRFSDDAGGSWLVPTFTSAAGRIVARFAAPHAGTFGYAVSAGDADERSEARQVEAVPYTGDNPLYRHGRLRVAASKRTLEHADGTPFLWIGDTWWMGLTTRLRWPEDFDRLLSDRVDKGFSVIQIVAGPLPDFESTPEGVWHPQQANEGGWPWKPGWEALDPAWFDAADRRIAAIVSAGVMPCIFATWAYYLDAMGSERALRHWRELIARYAAYPVVFCIAGELNYPGYERADGVAAQYQVIRDLVAAWTEIGKAVRQHDPFHNLITAHPSHPDIRGLLEDESFLDVNMIQTSHWSYHEPPAAQIESMTSYLGLDRPIRLGFAGALAVTTEAIARTPTMPVVNGEPCYEGLMGGNWEDVQRFDYWTGLLSGLAGVTYGADGVWQMSSDSEPFASPVSGWGTSTWQQSMHYRGSRHVGLARTILADLDWWELRPLAIEAAATAGRLSAFAASTGTTTLLYLPICLIEERLRGMRGLRMPLDPGRRHRMWFIDPRSATVRAATDIEPDGEGLWQVPETPSMEDWLLVIDSSGPS